MRTMARPQLLAFGALVLVVLALVACGTGLQLTGAHTITPADKTQTTGIPRTPRRVTVLVDKVRYTPTDAIHVTIDNGLATTILAYNDFANCTMVKLERSLNGVWVPQGRCILIEPTNRTVQVLPGTTTLDLRPPNGAAFSVGTYRVTFPYTTGTDPEAGPSAVAYSASFTVE